MKLGYVVKSLSVLGLLCVSTLASAEAPKKDYDISMVFSGASYHMDKRYFLENTDNPQRYNEVNTGLGLQINDWRLVVFKNSYYKTSVAVTWSPLWEISDTIKAGFRLGGAVGYGDTPLNKPLVPVVGAEVTWQTGDIRHVFGTLGYQTLTYHIQWEF